MILYRYLSAQFAIEALQTGKWKIGRTFDLNDPSDFRPSPASPKEPRWPIEFSKAAADQLIREYKMLWGVLCFSEAFDDPVLWSHYADQHRGIALGFEFAGDVPYPHFCVNYSNEVAEVDALAVTEASNEGKEAEATAMVRHAFGRKAKSWSYEKEWRCLLRLDHVGCTMEGLHQFASLPVLRLRSVLLGVRCPLHPFDVFRSIRRYPIQDAVEISQMKLQDRSYLLKKERYDVRPVACEDNGVQVRLYNTSAAIDELQQRTQPKT